MVTAVNKREIDTNILARWILDTVRLMRSIEHADQIELFLLKGTLTIFFDEKDAAVLKDKPLLRAVFNNFAADAGGPILCFRALCEDRPRGGRRILP